MNDNHPTQLWIKLQNRYVIFGLILISASIGNFYYAFAGSISAPLKVTATVVNSCKFSTDSSLADPESSASINTNSATYVNPAIDFNCHGASPRIAVNSQTLQSSVALTGPTTNAADKGVREVLAEAALNQIVTRSQTGRGVIAPEAHLGAKMMSAEQNGQGVAAGNYAEFVIITVNF